MLGEKARASFCSICTLFYSTAFAHGWGFVLRQRPGPGGQAMPPAAVNCLTCGTFYQSKPVKAGKLGEAPNKYCYRSKCHEEGIRRGHIKSSKRAASPPGGGGGSGLGGHGLEPMNMGRDMSPAQVYGASKLYKIHAVYGFRCAVPSCPLAPLTTLPDLTPLH